MSQHDHVIANAAGAAFRADLNLLFLAMASQNSGATEPATMYAYQFWADTTTGILKQRNAANSAWIEIGAMAEANLGLAKLSGATFTGLVNMKAGANIASSATIDLTAATGNTVHITGTTAISAVTMNAGQWCLCIADAALPLTYHATTNKITGGVSKTLAAGDSILYYRDNSSVVRGNIILASGSPVTPTPSVTASELAAIQAGTAITLNATTEVLSAVIPAAVKRITVAINGMSTNGASVPVLQIGDSGGYETTGYVGSTTTNFASNTVFSTSVGFALTGAWNASSVVNYLILLTRLDGNVWNCAIQGSGEEYSPGPIYMIGNGSKTLTAELDRVQLTMVNGTDSFDAGTAKIFWEF